MPVKPIIRTVEATGSTNADMLQLANGGAEEGIWLRAETQSGGRGRLARNWISPKGNLYCSTLVRLHEDDHPAHGLSFVAGVSLIHALRDLAPDIPAMLKWPNDLLLDQGKCAGILLERSGDAVIVGFGVNVASAPALQDRKTACLADFDLAIDPQDFLEKLAGKFATQVQLWRTRTMATTLAEWSNYAHEPGAHMKVNSGNDLISGEYDGLSEDGALRMRLPDGKVVTISAGDVSLIG